MDSESKSNVVAVSNQQQQKQRPSEGIKVENPFALKVGQVFTGFGIGCGIGIGVGRPLNLSALPMLNQVMGATRGATDAFSGVSRHVNNTMRKLGAKNIEAGIGCGIGFGHGFGVGLALKPRALHRIQSCFIQMMMAATKKLGMAPDLSMVQGALPISLQKGMSTINKPLNQNTVESLVQLSTQVSDSVSQGLPGYGNTSAAVGSNNEKVSSKSTSDFSRTEKVLSNFLENPILKEEIAGQDDVARHLQSESNLLRMVLNHQQIIEDLIEENENLRQILVEDLKISPSKLQTKRSSSKNKSPGTDCFECRQKQRKK